MAACRRNILCTLWLMFAVGFTWLAQISRIDLTSYLEQAFREDTQKKTRPSKPRSEPTVYFLWDGKVDESAIEAPPDETETADDSDAPPQVAWLASYPNSGTSYTMTMVERSTNWSTATMYGIEIATADKDRSEPVVPGGPIWEGLSGKRGTTIRHLPPTFVLTKTHCGGRCIKCPATEYVVDVDTFRTACLRVTGYDPPRQRFERQMSSSLLAKIVHLIRNPFTNVVARFHLEQRHMMDQSDDRYSRDATGFQKWCQDLDRNYEASEEQVFDADFLEIFRKVPCRAEFYKYAQWHNRMFELDIVKDEDYLIVHYENYEKDLDKTVASIMDFLQQSIKSPLRPFRPLPDYADHYSDADRRRIKRLIKRVASKKTWDEIERYFDD